ncbi:uncharacterized protein BHQ10_009338 [Talaromyces amestolkiae]|uniref:6-phosphogluconate dehydrogenase NADP-binding domain-containing protein n=1 Tax=Talaromyces amestolkiae TaxID=1196081 RepID=A0A364LBY1_TALAM|nr:uncharacterized protein BHQ10_009338 [Talaromyces amestolkiae]RAO73326.1 hypothetical protein BHQ10_009338 [Talaromyces amestolkiae]
MAATLRVGFIGLGFMGTPMALNLARRFPLTVWNRSPGKYSVLKESGASIVETPAKVLEASDITFLMLFNSSAITSILSVEFKRALRGKILVNTGSVEVEFSKSLAQEVQEAGGDYVEMPVSGSKVPAEQGQLVGMMAGDPEVAERIRPYVEPLTCSAIYCGPVGSGLKAKYAINTLLITLTVGLSESINLARAQGLDLATFKNVLDACPMASPYSKIKVNKILNEDWAPQAALKDCYNSTQLIEAAAASANTKSPLISICSQLYKEALEAGLGEEDMISVLKVVGRSSGRGGSNHP